MSVLSWSISRTRPKLNSSLCHQNCYVSHFTPHWVLFIFAYLREKKKRRICLYICLLPICPSTYLPVCLSVYPISVYLLTCLSIWYLSVCLSTYLSLSVYSSCTSLSPVQLVTWGSGDSSSVMVVDAVNSEWMPLALRLPLGFLLPAWTPACYSAVLQLPGNSVSWATCL